MRFILVLALGFLLDLLLGDPRFIPHPVVGMGKLIFHAERFTRKIFSNTPKGERIAGAILVLIVLVLTAGFTYGLIYLANMVSPLLGFFLESFWCFQILATKSLKTESMKVYTALISGNLENSRKAVSYIVGRDTANLTCEGVTKATVETIAENTSDGVVAPLIYLAIGGVPLGMIYKAINTMDSMVAYKNDKYRYFGTAAAKLDDLANFIPSRVAAILMVVSAKILKLNGKNAYKIWRRDRFNHASPNSAQTESTCAGALGVQLAGDAVYFGKVVKKPTIGDPLRKIEFYDIVRANKLLYATASLTFLLAIALRYVVFYI